ncbi:MAG: hypothetical protein K6E50_05060 [Lachnospiraceae bacterium]|nr:hypothetical protein [Lachnospiraceae bacterium]
MNDALDAIRSTFGTKHRSWPMFWGGGTIGGLAFTVMGFAIVIMSLREGTEDAAAVVAGVFIALLGMGLLFAVIFTRIWWMNDDLSLQIDLTSDRSRRKHDPERVVRYLCDQHNNIALVKSEQGMVRMFSAGNMFVVELTFFAGSDYSTFHMIDPEVKEYAPVVIQNIVLEQIPVRKNRLVKASAAQLFLRKLYEEKDMRAAMEGFSFLDTSAETKKLVETDAYIVPGIPVDLPKSDADRDAWMKRKEEKLQRALRVLNHSVLVLGVACLLSSCDGAGNVSGDSTANITADDPVENDGGYHPATDDQGVFVGQDKEVAGYYKRIGIARNVETLEEMQELNEEGKRGYLVVNEDGTACFELDGEKTEYVFDKANFYLRDDAERANGFPYTYINGRLIITDETSVTQYMRLTEEEKTIFEREKNNGQRDYGSE